MSGGRSLEIFVWISILSKSTVSISGKHVIRVFFFFSFFVSITFTMSFKR